MVKEEKSLAIAFLGFAALGAVFIIVWTVEFSDYLVFIKTAEEAAAIITGVETYSNTAGDTRNRVFVRFYVGRQGYDVATNRWDFTMVAGKAVTALYNPDDPYDFRLKSNIFYGWPFLLGGTTFFLIGITPSIKMLKRRLLKKAHKKQRFPT